MWSSVELEPGSGVSLTPLPPSTQALTALLSDDSKFGFIVIDGSGALFGTLQGNTREVLHKFTVDLPKKHGIYWHCLHNAQPVSQLVCWTSKAHLAFSAQSPLNILVCVFQAEEGSLPCVLLA